MTTGAESLRLILGLRVRGLREERGWTLKQFSQRCGLSISYLSEIEQGRKYPKPEKLLALSAGLGITYDELVASSGGDGQQPIEALLRSPLIGGFPFEVFGVRPEDVVRLLTEAPDRARALARAFVDLGRTYDLRLEDVLLSASRSYQERPRHTSRIWKRRRPSSASAVATPAARFRRVTSCARRSPASSR